MKWMSWFEYLFINSGKLLLFPFNFKKDSDKRIFIIFKCSFSLNDIWIYKEKDQLGLLV